MSGKGGHPIELRVQALALASYGVKCSEVAEITGISLRAVYDIVKRAKERGFDADVDARIRREYVEDGKRADPPNEEDASTKTKVESLKKRRADRRARREQGADGSAVQEEAVQVKTEA